MTCGWHITAPEDHVVVLRLTIKLPSYSTDKDSLEVFDVDGSEFTPIANPESHGGKMFSKFRFVYVEFKSDNVARWRSHDEGILVKKTAIKTGKTHGKWRWSRQNSETEYEKWEKN